MPPTEALNMIIVKNNLLDTTAYGLIKSKSNASLAGANTDNGQLTVSTTPRLAHIGWTGNGKYYG